MANVVSIIVYQINQRAPIVTADVSAIGFPTTGCILRDTINSPTRSLSTGYNVYSAIQLVATGDIYYTSRTYAQLVTDFNA